MKEYLITMLTATKILLLAILMLAEPLELLFFILCVLLVVTYCVYWYFSDKKTKGDPTEEKEEVFWNRFADIIFGGVMLIIFIPIIGDAIWFWIGAGVMAAANTAVSFAYNIKEKETAKNNRTIRRTAKTILLCFPLIYAVGGIITVSALCGGAAVFLFINMVFKRPFYGEAEAK